MKKKILAVCLAALSVAFTLTACGGASSTATTKNTTVRSTQTETTQRNASGLAYTKGVVIGNAYSNDWLNLKIEMPAKYQPASEELIRQVEGVSNSVCGMYFVSDKQDTVMLSFMDLSSAPDLTEKDCVEQIIQTAIETIEQNGAAASGRLGREVIADRFFQAAYIDAESGVQSGVQSIYAYKYENKMCVIMITGTSFSDNEKIAASFTTID